jgi:hypothetical protein
VELQEPYRIAYRFSFPDGSRKEFDLDLDPRTIVLRTGDSASLPAWTLLEHEQCTSCPLDSSRSPHCPIAVNLVRLVEGFKDFLSSDRVSVTCTTPERTYLKETSLQIGLHSIFGVIMATSACPVMDFFRPMARFHLPFSTLEESLVRTVSFYLLGEYFRHRQDLNPDWDLKRLEERYRRVKEVNDGFLRRIKTVNELDADTNALLLLHSLAQLLAGEMNSDLGSIRYLFVRDDTPGDVGRGRDA